MVEKIIIAGAGGQGIMLMGKILAEAAMRENKYVTWLPAYGAEVRGGTAYCMVSISSEEIGSPYISSADTLIVMNEPSLKKFSRVLKKDGFLLINSSLISSEAGIKADIFKGDFSNIALSLGNARVANVVALGYYLACKKIVDPQVVLKVIDDMAPKARADLAQINKEAFLIGINKGDKNG